MNELGAVSRLLPGVSTPEASGAAPARRSSAALALRAPDAPGVTPFACTGADRTDLRTHAHAGIAACACGVHAALATPKKLPGDAPPLAPVHYEVAIANPSSGYLEVTAHFPTDGKETLELAMARWTPGSYKIRDYEKNVDDDLRALNGKGEPLDVVKRDVSRWTIATNGADTITVRYRVYAHTELSVRTNWIDPGFALLNGAATFMTIAGDAYERRHDVRIDAPAYAAGPISALDTKDGATFTAPSFDVLVDSPIVLGADSRLEIVLDGTTYTLATHGAGEVWETKLAARMAATALRELHSFWGEVPYKRYTILNLLSEARGGLEHKDSSVLMHSRWSTRSRADLLNWVSLLVHEVFHAVNVKRLRPAELGPFDYTRENVTSSLWVAEGVTAYYDKLLVRRSGLSTSAEYLAQLSQTIAAVQGQPGRTVQTLCASSRDAWTNYYQPDENSPNVQVSYYEKGALVAFLLDAELRRVTDGKKSLRDVMVAAYQRYAGEAGYTPEQFEALVSEIAGVDMSAWFDRAVRSTEELPIAGGLKALGLRFKESGEKSGEGAALGVETKLDGHRMVVSRVIPDSPGAKAGLMVGDEVLGLGDYRVAPGVLESRLKRYQAGEQTTVLVARRDQLLTLPATLGAKTSTSWEVEIDPASDPVTAARRVAWMGA